MHSDAICEHNFFCKQEKGLASANEEVLNKCGYFEKFLLADNEKGFFVGDKVN